MVTRARPKTAPASVIAAALAGLASGCSPEIPDTSSLVSAPILLAAAASPAESRPGAEVMLRALPAGPNGPTPRALDWAWCTARPPLTAPGSLSPDCVGIEGPALVPLGTGDTVAAAMPAAVCQTFGPDQPAPPPGQPAGRPADPDPTGGYYQPLRILDPAAEARTTASFEVRALCNLAGANPAQQAEHDRRYRPNENPSPAGLTLEDGTPIPSVEADPASVTAIAVGTMVVLRAEWPSCPLPGQDSCGDGVCGIDESADGCPGDCAAPSGCAGAEAFLWFDPASRSFSARRESIVVSWFATGGAFATARTGRAEPEVESYSDNLWTSPLSPGEVWLWVVLRDARGGVGWATYRLRVE